MIFRLPSVLDRLTPSLHRDEAGLLEERGHLSFAVATAPVVDCGQLKGLSANGVELLIPDGVGRRDMFRPPCDSAHSASGLEHAAHLVEALSVLRQVKQDERDDRRIELI